MKLSFEKSKKENENTTKKCSACMAEIPLKAKKCQHCRAKQKEKIGRKHLILIGFVVVIFIVLFNMLGDGDNISTPQTQNIDGQKAFIISQSYVKSVLKSPASADFPALDYTATNLGNDKWKVVSYVDSQNSFGASIRTNWTVILTYFDGDWADSNSWHLKELIVDDKIIYSIYDTE